MVQARTDGNVAWAATHVQEAVLRRCSASGCHVVHHLPSVSRWASCTRVKLSVLCPPHVLEALVWSCIAGGTLRTVDHVSCALSIRGRSGRSIALPKPLQRVHACDCASPPVASKREARLAHKASAPRAASSKIRPCCAAGTLTRGERLRLMSSDLLIVALSSAALTLSAHAEPSAAFARSAVLRAVYERVYSTCVRGAVGSGRTFQLRNSHRFGSDHHCR